jgi:hypothetical protein
MTGAWPAPASAFAPAFDVRLDRLEAVTALPS